MAASVNDDAGQSLRGLRRGVASLQRAVYSRPDPTERCDLLQQWAKAQSDLLRLDKQAIAVPASSAPEATKPTTSGRLLGP
jgi:hypothetical protein